MDAALVNVTGSWLFVRSTHPAMPERLIHHFTADGKCYWEVDHEGKRLLTRIRYRFADGKLTLCYSGGTEREFALFEERDGTVRFHGVDDHVWWMVRLGAPEPYSRAFVNEHGQLQKLSEG
jgi:hypothetical protein